MARWNMCGSTTPCISGEPLVRQQRQAENAEGIATLTYSQFVNNFTSGMNEST